MNAPRKFPEPQPFEEGPAPHIALDSVESNQIASIGYDSATQTLAVSFTRGQAVYHYPDVAPETFEAFKAAESKGKFFGEHIKALPFKKYHLPEDNDFPLGAACDMSGEQACEACQ